MGAAALTPATPVVEVATVWHGGALLVSLSACKAQIEKVVCHLLQSAVAKLKSSSTIQSRCGGANRQ